VLLALHNRFYHSNSLQSFNMKFTYAIAAFILAYTANAAAIAEADAEAMAWCRKPGEPCAKIKRHAEAVAEAFAEPKAEPEAEAWCRKPGEPCAKAKRDADADAAAAAWCRRPGEPCAKAKRHAEAIAEAVAAAHPEPLAFLASLDMRSAFPEADAMPDAGPFIPISLLSPYRSR
jgi:hypothetical protein